MKKLFLMLVTVLVNVNVTFADGLITPPTENVTTKHYSLGAWYWSDDDSKLAWTGGYYVTMVWSNDGKEVWISNLFQDNFMDAAAESEGYEGMTCWVHGTVSDNKINFTKEKIFHATNTTTGVEYDIYLGGVSISDAGVETLLDSFNMVIADNGDVKLEDPELYVCALQLNADGSAIVDEGGISTEDFVVGHEFIQLDESQIQYPVIPETVEMKSFTYKTTLYGLGEREKVCTLGFDGSDVYVKGMSTVAGVTDDYAFPDVVFKGTLAADGNSFSLPSKQFYGIYDFLGIYYVTFMYGCEFKTESGTSYVDPCDKVTFTKDGENWVVSSDQNIARASLDNTLYTLESEVSLTPYDDSAIDAVEDGAKPASGAAFNLFGQKVSGNAKGLVISNGKKLLK